MTKLNSPENRESLSIPKEISRSIALYLLEEQVGFAMEPVQEGQYQVTIPLEVSQRVQTKINELQESGLLTLP